MPHAVIHRLVIYPPDPDMGVDEPTRALELSIDGVPIVVNLPLARPITRAGIKAFLLSILPQIHASYDANFALQPTHNLSINQEFDFQWPEE